MIVPMKKITVLVQSKDIDTTLGALRKAGVLHIEHQNLPINEEITGLEEKYHSLLKAIGNLPDSKDQEDPSRKPAELVDEVLNLAGEREIIAEDLKKAQKDIGLWQEWGDFDPDIIDDLKDRNIWVRLGKVTKKEMRHVPEGVIIEQVFKKGSVIYCAVISTKEISLPFEDITLPEKSLTEMHTVKRHNEDRIEKIIARLKELGRYKNRLYSYKSQLESLIEFNKVAAGRGQFKMLSYIAGYCPAYSVNLIETLAENERWGLVIEDPREGDNVPTLIKNPPWVDIIRPVFQMIKTIPGYRELDISLWFLLFFSVFFGILIGDAGYGLVFFILNLILHLKLRQKIKTKSIFFLTYVLSFCAMVWGLLSGTFFGQAYLPKRVEPLLPFLRDSANVQALCFFIGALHLSIAHAWRFLQRFPSLKAFSEAGWIFMLWAAYLLARTLILGEIFPWYGRYFLIAGAAAIILFTNPVRNIFKGIAYGLGDLLLHIVNSFTDVVSYIRLFAVGTATVAVADAFNQMAAGVGYSSLLLGFLTALILLLGHTLNIVLSAIAILVHGVRLNVLEFSSHLNMEWSGIEYAPFKER